MNRKKSTSAIMVVLIITSTLFASVLLDVGGASLRHDPSWYNAADGEHLKVGFSKYGELVGIKPGSDPDLPANWVGLEYDGRDPFANPSIAMEYWTNGWLIDISYINPVTTDPNRMVWAYALFSDGFEWGYDWMFVPYDTNSSPPPAPYGGRKSNAYAETEPWQLKYNSSRTFIAFLKTHIYDWQDDDGDGVRDLGMDGEVWPLLDINMTMIFKKDEREVILLKDIELTLDSKYLLGKVDVQFSEREEWSLGSAPSCASYVHMFKEAIDACYGEDEQWADKILRKYVFTYNVPYNIPAETWIYFTEMGCPQPEKNVAPNSEKVFLNGYLQWDYTINYTAPGRIKFKDPLTVGDVITVNIKKEIQRFPNKYDVVQVISQDLDYVGYEAMWPVLSDWTVDGGSLKTAPLVDVQVSDAAVEPTVPFSIKEWDFMLGLDAPRYRVREVKGLKDYHDAKDYQMPGNPDNQLDQEVVRQLRSYPTNCTVRRVQMFLDGLELLKKFDDKGEVQELVVSTAVVQEGHEEHKEAHILGGKGSIKNVVGIDFEKHLKNEDLIIMDDGPGEGNGPDEWPRSGEPWNQEIYDYKQCDHVKSFSIRISIIELDYHPIWEKLITAVEFAQVLINKDPKLMAASEIVKQILKFIQGDESENPDEFEFDGFEPPGGWPEPCEIIYPEVPGRNGIFQIKLRVKITILPDEPCKSVDDASKGNPIYPWTDIDRAILHQVGTNLEVNVRTQDEINPPDDMTDYSLTYRVFIDSDADLNTGFNISGIGADYIAFVNYKILEEEEETYRGELMKFVSGTNWEFIDELVWDFDHDNMGIVMSLPLKSMGISGGDTIHAVFRSEDTFESDITPDCGSMNLTIAQGPFDKQPLSMIDCSVLRNPQAVLIQAVSAYPSDWTAAGYIAGDSPTMQVRYDTDPSVINTTTGEPRVPQGSGILLLGGPIANKVVRFYEGPTGGSPLLASYNATHIWFEQRGIGIIDESILSFGQLDSEDVFIIEHFKDTEGRYVLISYGYSWKGTFAAGLFYNIAIKTHLNDFDRAWYVVKWTDDGDSNVEEPSEDTYYLIEQGP